MKTLAKLLFVIFIAIIATSSFAAKKDSCDPNDNAVLLFKDMVRNSELADAIKKDPSLGEAWALLKDAGYNKQRKDVTSITNVAKLLANSKLSSSGLDYEKIKNLLEGNRGQGATAVDKITVSLNTLVSSGTKFNNINRLISDLKKGANFNVGARYVARYIYENTGEFSNKTLEFEQNINGNRRVDLVVGNLHYEFKSDKNSPPPRFAEEFVKDLQNVNNLNQLKWIFDKKKVSSLDKQAFLDKLESAGANGQLTQKIIDKFVDPEDLADGQTQGTYQNLIDEIDNQFNTIFQVK